VLNDFADEGEIGEKKKKYAQQIAQIKEMFPVESDDDLAFALDEVSGDIATVIDQITDGKHGPAHLILSTTNTVKAVSLDSPTSRPRKSGPSPNRKSHPPLLPVLPTLRRSRFGLEVDMIPFVVALEVALSAAAAAFGAAEAVTPLQMESARLETQSRFQQAMRIGMCQVLQLKTAAVGTHLPIQTVSAVE
jgi:hypothetical protein